MLGESHLDLPRSGSSSCIRVHKLHLDVPSSDDRSSNRIRTFGPREVENQFHIYELKDEIGAVIANIEKMCSCVQLGKGFLEKGFCFGLVNPIANIIINSAISQVCAAADRTGGGGSDISQVCPRAGGGGGRRRKRGEEKPVDPNLLRSLDGLTAFLTCLFPYLPDAEARLYLDAADADPFVASLLIIDRRQLREFDFNSQTTQAAVEVALRCAAVAAKHPDPEGLVLGWKCLTHSEEGWECISHAVEPFSSVPSSQTQHYLVFLVQQVVKANWASDPVLRLERTWELARSRLMQASSRIYASPTLLPPTRAHMKRMLLSTIHGFYVQAMGRLPTYELCNWFHCSMLKGGYCYGPLDPVSNIIVNTICPITLRPRVLPVHSIRRPHT
uniref:PIR2-like helical domain-containing protein n=1 Tax=Oryza punctata TaxID=4537 RepID=A0A0E0JTW2_ORYPU